MNQNNERITNETLYPGYKDGQILQHTDVNKMIDVLKTGVNANYDDIKKMENGEKVVSKAASLNGLVATTFEDGTLDNSDETLPTSKKVKQYVDNKVSEATPTKGVDYFTEAEIQGIKNDIESNINEDMSTTINTAVTNGESAIDTYIANKEASANTSINNLASQKLDAITSASSTALSNISDAKGDALDSLDDALAEAESDFNSNASSKTLTFNTNATNRTTIYNDNASSKLSEYNTNSENKTTSFNDNYDEKLSAFNTNATNKTNAFDTNANNKTNTFDTVADRKITILQNLIAAIPDDFGAFRFSVVQSLPETGLSMTLYLVPIGTNNDNQNVYEEYIWLEDESRYEVLGTVRSSADIDLSQYATISDIANMITTTSFATDSNAGIIRTGYSSTLDGEKQICARIRTYEQYQNMSGNNFIGKGTLENVLAGKGYDNDITSLKNDRDALVDLTTGNTTISAEGKSITIDKRILSLKNFELLGDTTQDRTPTPESPVAIQTATGNQEINVCGKNLFKCIASDINLNGLTPVVASDGSLNCSGTITQTWSNLTEMVDIFLPAGTYTFSLSKTYQFRCVMRVFHNKVQEGTETNYTNIEIASGLTSKTITLNENVYHIRFYITGVTANTEVNENFKVQVEVGSQATPFEKYKGKNYKISLGNIELCKIGDYQDRIYKQNDKWYLEKNVGKVVLNGTQDIIQINTEKTNTTRIMYRDLIVGRNADNQVLCNYLTSVLNWNEDIEGIFINGNDLVIRINKSVIGETTNSINNWLSTHNTIVYYILVTPTTTEITDENLISQLEAIELINGVNNIYSVSSNLNAYMKIDAYANVIDILENKADKSELDSKQDKLTAGTNITIASDGTISATGGSTFSGDYNDLTNKPTIFSGSYDDLSNKPTIPDKLKDLADDSTHRLVTDTEKQTWNNKSSFSGNYNDLSNKPTLFSGSYSDLSNKPTIPTVPDIVDNLTTNDATKTLSAKQGKILKDALDDKANADEVIQEQSPFYGASTYLTAAEVIDLIHANKMNIMIYGNITPLLDRSEGN